MLVPFVSASMAAAIFREILSGVRGEILQRMRDCRGALTALNCAHPGAYSAISVRNDLASHVFFVKNVSITIKRWCMPTVSLAHAIMFLVVALIAAAVGFGGVPGVAMEGARLLFWIFIALFVISLIANLLRRG